MYFICVCTSYVLGTRVAIFVCAGLGDAQAPCGPLRLTMEPASRRLFFDGPPKLKVAQNAVTLGKSVRSPAGLLLTWHDPTPSSAHPGSNYPNPLTEPTTTLTLFPCSLFSYLSCILFLFALRTCAVWDSLGYCRVRRTCRCACSLRTVQAAYGACVEAALPRRSIAVPIV